MVWRVLGVKDLQPYHAHCVHTLKASDHQPHADFSRWNLQRLAVQPDFPAHVLFTDECSFSWEGIFNAQKHTTGRTLTQTQRVPANIKAHKGFQYVGAPAHFSADVQSALDAEYPGR
ncbi:hypothetical protein TNCV_3438841 [Trichonephila clavipes]|nr:hypothetical protein TNCV_3438841 [Trichonephila clavipes]